MDWRVAGFWTLCAAGMIGAFFSWAQPAAPKPPQSIPTREELLDKLSVIQVKDNLIEVDQPGSLASISIFPRSTSWSVDCLIAGLSVTFGYGAEATEVPLTSAHLTPDECRDLAPFVASHLNSLIGH